MLIKIDVCTKKKYVSFTLAIHARSSNIPQLTNFRAVRMIPTNQSVPGQVKLRDRCQTIIRIAD